MTSSSNTSGTVLLLQMDEVRTEKFSLHIHKTHYKDVIVLEEILNFT